VYFTNTLAIPNLDATTTLRFSVPMNLTAAASGRYTVQQEVVDDAGVVLSSPSTSFLVQAAGGLDAFAGTLSVSPAVITRGETAQLLGNVLNRGSNAVSDLPVDLLIIDPSAGNTVVATFPSVQSLAAGANSDHTASWSTTNVAPKAYVALLRVRLNGEERVLAQKPVQVVSLALSGTVAATPSAVLRGQSLQLGASVRNDGTGAGNAIALRLRVLRAETGVLEREFSYSADLPAGGGSFARQETVATQTLSIGRYELRWLAIQSR
jgi:hypothetical protein